MDRKKIPNKLKHFSLAIGLVELLRFSGLLFLKSEMEDIILITLYGYWNYLSNIFTLFPLGFFSPLKQKWTNYHRPIYCPVKEKLQQRKLNFSRPTDPSFQRGQHRNLTNPPQWHCPKHIAGLYYSPAPHKKFPRYTPPTASKDIHF